MSVGFLEMLLIFVVFVAFGPRRIANFYHSIERGVRDFVGALGGDKEAETKTLERGKAEETLTAARDDE